MITQTVEIPASHRLTIDVPREVPAGPAVIVFKPAAKPAAMTAEEAQKAMEAIERCSGLAKRLGFNLSSDEFLESRLKDKELKDRLDHLDQWQ
jgi:hypothetical protein